MDENNQAVQKERDYLVPASIMFGAIIIAGAIIYVLGGKQGGTAAVKDVAPAPAAQQVPPIGGRDVILGDAQAPVAFIEYGDYQCPFCGRVFSSVEPKLRENYIKSGVVKMIYRNFTFLGPESFAAAEAAECSKDQQKFWGFHDALYVAEVADGVEHNGNLSRDLFLKIAGSLKLDIPAFTQCFDSKKYSATVEEETKAGRDAGVNSTPTVFVNGFQIRGAVPYEDFASAIDRARTGQ